MLTLSHIDDEPCIYFDDESWHDMDRSEVRRSRGGLWARGGCESYMADDEWETLEFSDSKRLEDEYQRMVKAGEFEDIDAFLDRPRWIPVGERLPEELEQVIVWMPDCPHHPCGMDMGSCMTDSWGVSWMVSGGRSAFPTHWMPLPAPPTDAK